jgi:hypothetical protein
MLGPEIASGQAGVALTIIVASALYDR